MYGILCPGEFRNVVSRLFSLHMYTQIVHYCYGAELSCYLGGASHIQPVGFVDPSVEMGVPYQSGHQLAGQWGTYQKKGGQGLMAGVSHVSDILYLSKNSMVEGGFIIGVLPKYQCHPDIAAMMTSFPV